jgi:hypothetical protein
VTARTVTIGWSHDDVDFRVVCTLTPGSPGRGADLNGPGEPAEGPEVIIEEVREDAPGGAARPDLLEAAQADFDLIEEGAVEKAGDDEDSSRDSAEQLAVDCARDEQRLGC